MSAKDIENNPNDNAEEMTPLDHQTTTVPVDTDSKPRSDANDKLSKLPVTPQKTMHLPTKEDNDQRVDNPPAVSPPSVLLLLLNYPSILVLGSCLDSTSHPPQQRRRVSLAQQTVRNQRNSAQINVHTITWNR